jgi:peptidoglycan/xylan/chitin deacetylase (PgdA/CDA1 family)
VKRLLLTFDVEELDLGSSPAAVRDPTSPSAEGLDEILPVLGRIGIPATFFCTAHFALSQPKRVRSIAARGHEVASHGWEHGDDYGRLTPRVALARLLDSRRLLEDVSGREVRGVRTPRLSACSAGILSEAGFAYDASPHPTWVKTGLAGLRMPRRPGQEAGLLRVPLSVVPVLRLPVAWYVFRATGAGALHALARLAACEAPYLHLYFHPWEAARLCPDRMPHLLAWRTGPGWVRRLEALLARLAPSFVPSTVGSFVAAGWTKPCTAPSASGDGTS